MTCVVGVRGRNGVLIAADSQVSWDNRVQMDAGPKVGALSDVLAFGYCGSGRLGDILTYRLVELTDPAVGRDEREWAVTEFVPYLRVVLEAEGFLHVWRNVENFGESAFMLAVRDRLFMVEGDLAVSEHVRPFDATGSGHEVAIGSLAAAYSADDVDDDELEAIAGDAVRAAAAHTAFVGGDVMVVRTSRFTDDELAFARAMLRR